MSKFLIKTLLLSSFVIVGMNTVNAQKKGRKKGKEIETKTESFVLTNEIDSVSYGVGLNMAISLKKDFSEANMDAVIQGLTDGLKKDSALFTPEQMQMIVMMYFKEKASKASNEKQKELQEIAVKGNEFLKENATKEGVTVTESGLQYIVLTEGTGKQPTATSSVTVHYHGTTPDGEVFDSSVNRGRPATFGLNQVIKGWTEGLQLMKEGAKYRFFIPQDLAYGKNAPQNGEGPIKPYMPLVFEVELIKVND
ncbi:MAG: FKBP-type peptidyl-prolyl cis-trans isomerase [Flavobacteriales bacterium]|nr:FKBP-type peptidyl-prolyl cis-trans isomerase [Flavobacteriales bacterium]MCB9365002.1 FKBP-type peptidyl-prolyl cis-trans isomerase [Flavobacteriales bacterium]